MRKGLFVIFIMSVIMFSMKVHADGPPMNSEGEVYVDHLIIVMNDEQLKEVGQTRLLTLTEEQHKFFKKQDERYPRKVEIITPYYRDCTCGLNAYGVWNKQRHIAMPLSQLRFMNYGPKGELYQIPKPKTLSEGGTVVIDDRGDMYFNNKPLKKSEVKEAINKITTSDDGEKKIVCFNFPPSINNDVDKTIKALVDELREYARLLQVRTCIAG
jgi:hypothetical protein